MKTYLYHVQHRTLVTGGRDLVAAWSTDPDTRIWLDVSGEISEDMMGDLQQWFNLHPLALKDASRDRHPPKIEVFDADTFLLFKEMEADAEGIDGGTIQLAVFVGERFLVTRHSGPSVSIQRIRTLLESDPGLFADGSGTLALRLARTMVDRYLRMLLDLEDRLEELENGLLENPDDNLLNELVIIKSDLVRLRRVFHYQVQLLDELRGSLMPGFSPQDDHLITDLYEHQERIKSLSDLYYGLASDLVEGYISVASHRLNQIMRVLTIITAVFVPLSFLAGIYGMNFEYMPELKSGEGYFVLLGVMLTIASTLIVVFRRKKWL